MVWGGLQDNNAWCGMSSGPGGGGGGGGGGGPGGALTGAEWFTVAGGDGEYAVPAPSDSSVLYVDSQNGNVTRVDLKTGVTRSIRPYLLGVQERKPADLQYRFNWTTPIEVSPSDANVVLLGGNVVFKTTDGGEHWAAISPDLTRNDKSKQVTSGGPINYDISGAETYNTILTINLAPTDANVIWTGSDDGLVHVTRDGGKTWTNVSGRFPGLAPNAEGRVYQIGVSPFDAGTAYLAVDRHQLDDRRPYVYKTTDYGKTWTDIARGLPQEGPARVVRENPNVRGFLVLGSDAALDYYPKTALETSAAPAEGGEPGGRQRRGRVIVTVTDAKGDTVVVDSGGPGKQGVSRYVWNLRYAGPTRLAFEKPTGAEEEENPFRQAGGPRVVPGTYAATLSAGGRTQTATVTVEPDPFLGGDPARFAAQLRSGLEWRNAVSALNEMLNRIVSLETQLKNVQQARSEEHTSELQSQS